MAPLLSTTESKPSFGFWGLAGPIIVTALVSAESDGPPRGKGIVTSVGVFSGVAGLFLSLRIYSRCWSRGYRSYGLDDLFLTLSWILTIGQSILTARSVIDGYGSPIETIHSLALGSITYDRLLAFTLDSIASSYAKISFCTSLIRLAIHRPWLLRLLWFMIASTFIVQFVVVLLPFTICKPGKKLWEPWMDGTCSSSVFDAELTFGAFAAVYSGVQDLMLTFVFPWFLLPQLHVHGLEWVGVAASMIMGVMATTSSFLRAFYIMQPPSYDFTVPGISLTPWVLSEPSFLIIGASIPFLRNLLGVHKPGGLTYIEENPVPRNGASSSSAGATSDSGQNKNNDYWPHGSWADSMMDPEGGVGRGLYIQDHDGPHPGRQVLTGDVKGKGKDVLDAPVVTVSRIDTGGSFEVWSSAKDQGYETDVSLADLQPMSVKPTSVAGVV